MAIVPPTTLLVQVTHATLGCDRCGETVVFDFPGDTLDRAMPRHVAWWAAHAEPALIGVTVNVNGEPCEYAPVED